MIRTVLKRKKKIAEALNKPQQKSPAPPGAGCASFRASHQVHTQTGAAPALPGNWARTRHQLLSAPWLCFFNKFYLEIHPLLPNVRGLPEGSMLCSKRAQILFHALPLAYCPHNWLWCHQDSLMSERCSLEFWCLCPCFLSSTSPPLRETFLDMSVCAADKY